jgi:hypothetical protein
MLAINSLTATGKNFLEKTGKLTKKSKFRSCVSIDRE